VEAIGRFIARTPGCRQGTILAPWRRGNYCPAAGSFALGHFGSKSRPQGRGEVTWAATRPRAGQRRAAQASVETRAAQSDRAPVAQASVSWASDSCVARGRGPGRRPGAVTAVTQSIAT
jgi:hypothetical protein